jgi:hypothetical protein
LARSGSRIAVGGPRDAIARRARDCVGVPLLMRKLEEEKFPRAETDFGASAAAQSQQLRLLPSPNPTPYSARLLVRYTYLSSSSPHNHDECKPVITATLSPGIPPFSNPELLERDSSPVTVATSAGLDADTLCNRDGGKSIERPDQKSIQ